MARPVSQGTPERAHHYLAPRPAYPLVVQALALGLGAFVLFVLFEAAGFRRPLMPGSLIGPHATIANCQECHVRDPRQGTSNTRCQRCHDPAGAGRLTQVGHVSQIAAVGRRNARALDEAEPLECARCHVEHRGSSGLAAVPESQCLSCHAARRSAAAGQAFRITSFEDHPEFAVVRQVTEAKGRGQTLGVETTGIVFTHDHHVELVQKALGRTGSGVTLQQICEQCHRPARRQRGLASDFTPVTYDAHCASCHDKKELPMSEGAPEGTVHVPGGEGPAGCGDLPAGFTCADGAITKAGVTHKDEWVLRELRRLQRVLHPKAYEAERAGLVARESQLERRLSLAVPLAGLEAAELEEMRALFSDEMRALDVRIEAESAAGAAGAGGARVAEVAEAAAAAGETEPAEALKAALGGLPSGDVPILTPQQFEERRREMLSLLSAVDAAADAAIRELRTGRTNEEVAADPAFRAARVRKARANELRRRLLALAPGEDGTAGLRRARAQRVADLARVQDEVSLRRSGVPAERRLEGERLALEDALKDVRRRLQVFRDIEKSPAAAVDGEGRARREVALGAVFGRPPAGTEAGQRCQMCHVLQDGGMVPVRAAHRVLVLSAFPHEPHLRDVPSAHSGGFLARLFGRKTGLPSPAPPPPGATGVMTQKTSCSPCHVSLTGKEAREVQFSKDARDLHVMGVKGCQECHNSRAVRQDCQLCHRYHPPA